MLELKVPPLLLFNIFAAVILLPAEYPIRLDNEGFLAGSILVAAALTIALLATMTFKRAKTTVNPYSFDNVNTLVTSGVFGYSRNPMYLAMSVALLGIGLIVDSAILAVLVVLGFVSYLTKFQILPEERLLADLFGTEYRQYCQKVRRWI
ncbi:methyltransferase family protein [Photobacterium lutimaris]|uniref:Isoprenylcysteine carboxylmethyltransferase family protein n=1 Tax=Photobacterium lutimaris TaxID=388278 RepID=A0A2T3IXX9_9GAMM|nr:isoprenylcysteine carboxylmethyltransferase family protein [Photobacterium lutimaris]PSU33381.1 isoprenylcysteine carboxylmethyltransferase family protein [Photobacterium lutimaris]TDR75023.1 phospholipid methyltransferase [Photobacterium lutimaris]